MAPNDDIRSSTKRPTILVTGGAGYIGSHTVLMLLKAKFPVVVIDNCSGPVLNDQTDVNGNVETLPKSLIRVQKLTNEYIIAFYNMDLTNADRPEKFDQIFLKHQVKVVIHFAALKSVSESLNLPLEYYTNNVCGTINLLNSMRRVNCRDLIFSSSATVYGLPQYLPVDEKHPTGLNILNPYGRTKYMVEQILKDLTRVRTSGSSWRIVALRYFNPVGAHPSGLLGEHLTGTPNNLMPYVAQVSAGIREKLFIFGNDYPTIDGTGVRDYIHIMDLAEGHLYALEYLLENSIDPNMQQPLQYFKAYNLGTGKGYSVLEMIQTYENVSNGKVPYEVVGRREGDAGSVYADVELAKKELKWEAKLGIVEMCRDAYKWQTSSNDHKIPSKNI